MQKEHSCSQIRIITRITAGACLLSMLLCYKLWLTERPFPLSPVADFLPVLSYPLDLIFFILTILCLASILILKNPQRFIVIFLMLAFFLALLDQNRWQPWFYQYVLMFLVLSGFNFRCDDLRHQRAIILTFKLMMVAIYFWSGLHKLNPKFLSDTFPWLMEPFTQRIGYVPSWFTVIGYSFPLIEVITGLLFLFPRFQRTALVISTLMHCFILLILSPFGHNYNPVVWPWNLAMILFNILLFGKKMPILLSEIRTAFTYHSVKIVLLFFVLMPLLNFFNSWDSYLSHNLYSGNTSNGSIYVSDSLKNNLPVHIRQYAIGDLGQNQINIKYWCMMEIGVPAYPEKRNFVAVTSTLYQYTSDSSEIYLMYVPKLSLKDKK